MHFFIRDMKYAIYLGLVLSGVSYADTATDQQLSLEAVATTLNVSAVENISEKKAEATRFIEDQLQSSEFAESIASATIAFATGKSAEDVQRFVDDYSMEVSRAEIKHPVGNEGRVITVSIGAFTLSLLEGSLSERLKIASGAQQFAIMQRSSESLVTDSGFLEFVEVPVLKFYKLEVIGSLEHINEISKNLDVAAIALDHDSSKVQSFLAQKENVSKMKSGSNGVIVRRLDQGLPPGVRPEQVINRQGIIRLGQPQPGFGGGQR